MFNINLDFKNINEMLKGPAGVGALMLFSLLIGFIIGLKSIDKNCTAELEQITVLRGQVAELEEEKLSYAVSVSDDIIKSEKDICQKRIEDFKAKYKALRCSICSGEDKAP
jgi:hypothetical protein